jgi:hypothetical protein
MDRVHVSAVLFHCRQDGPGITKPPEMMVLASRNHTETALAGPSLSRHGKLGNVMNLVLRGIRSGSWLTKERMTAYVWMLLVTEFAGTAYCIAGTHGLIVPLQTPASTDFVSFYAAGRLAASGAAWLAYDRAAHYAAEQQATAPGIAYNFFYYPPVFLLVCAVLARLPYLWAYAVFQVGSLAACVLAVRAILPNTRLLFLLAFPAVFWAAGTGQNALLTASLFAAATWQIDRRPILAGILFGAVCYKPHFGLLIPIALVAGGYGRVFAAAAGTVVALIVVSGMAFGWETWIAFLHAMPSSQSVYTSHDIDLNGLASPFGAMLVLGQGPWRASVVQAICSLGAAVLVGVVWQRRLSLPVRAAVLAAAVPAAAPIIMYYDLMLAGVAVAWLVKAGQSSGFAPWTKTLLAMAFLLPLFSKNVGDAHYWPVAPATAALVLSLAATAAWRESRFRQAAPLLAYNRATSAAG